MVMTLLVVAENAGLSPDSPDWLSSICMSIASSCACSALMAMALSVLAENTGLSSESPDWHSPLCMSIACTHFSSLQLETQRFGPR